MTFAERRRNEACTGIFQSGQLDVSHRAKVAPPARHNSSIYTAPNGLGTLAMKTTVHSKRGYLGLHVSLDTLVWARSKRRAFCAAGQVSDNRNVGIRHEHVR